MDIIMGKITLDGKFKRNAFEIKASVLPLDESKSIDISPYVSNIYIVNNYEEFSYTFLKIELEKIPKSSELKEYITSVDSIKIILTIKIIESIDNHVENKDEYLMKDAHFIVMKSGYLKTGSASDLEASAVFDLLPEIPKIIDRKLVNGFFHDCNISEVISSLIEETKIKNKLYNFYISTPENKKQYENIIIPPNGLFKTLEYLQQVYGIYAEDLIVFFTEKEGFIMSSGHVIGNILKPETGIIEIETTLASEKEPKTIRIGYELTDTSLRIKTSEMPSQTNEGKVQREAEGSRVKVIGSNDNNSEVTDCFKGDPVLDSREGPTRVNWTPYDNELLTKKLQNRTRTGFLPISISFADIRPDLFHPCRQFRLVSDSVSLENFEGNWKPVIVSATIKKEGVSATSVGYCSMNVKFVPIA
jgi:hypothetical protein